MKLLPKLTIGLSVPCAVVGLGGWFLYQGSSDLLRESILTAADAQASAVISAVDETLNQYVRQWQGFLVRSDTQRMLLTSEDRYNASPDPEAWIDAIDRAWNNDGSSQARAVKAASSAHELSVEMRERAFLSSASEGQSVFGEAFLTDRRGANLAQTGPTSDFRQNDESWWTIARDRGVFIGQVEWDDSLDDYALPISLRAESAEGEFLGVLKVVLRASALGAFIDSLTPENSVWEQVQFSLVTRDGTDLLRSSRQRDADWLRPLLDQALQNANGAVARATVQTSDGERLVVVAGRPILRGAGWWAAVIKHNPAAVLAPVRSLGLITAAATLTTVLLVVLASGVAIRSIVRRIEELRQATARLTEGENDIRIADQGNDELSELARALESMAIEFSVNEQQRSNYMASLERTNDVIRSEMARRRQLEWQLVQAQKLESIGQLAAGVAHEINTPMQYVSDNTRFLSESFDTLMRVVNRYAECAGEIGDDATLQEQLRAADALAEQSDISFLRTEIPGALAQSIEGIDRIADIVRAMKGFSHPGTGAKEPADLNKAIESTIVVCRHRWKYVADVQLDLQPDLPPVPCYLGEINQVVLNLVVNAADAIGDVVGDGQERRGSIRVSTRRDGDSALIIVADSGAGIPDAIKNRVFDPFFTTKGVGKGTGQGLAICHTTIVNRHAGSITIDSTPGVGTTFTIRLPLSHAASAAPIAEAA